MKKIIAAAIAALFLFSSCATAGWTKNKDEEEINTARIAGGVVAGAGTLALCVYKAKNQTTGIMADPDLNHPFTWLAITVTTALGAFFGVVAGDFFYSLLHADVELEN